MKKSDAHVSGMVEQHSRKDASRVVAITTMKKKDFVQRFIGNDPDKRVSQAIRAYEEYRVATLKEFSERIAQQILEGKLVLDGARFNRDGQCSALTVMRQVRLPMGREEAIEALSRSTGIPEEELNKVVDEFQRGPRVAR